MHVHRAGKYSPKITMQYLFRLQRDTVYIYITINILKSPCYPFKGIYQILWNNKIVACYRISLQQYDTDKILSPTYTHSIYLQ